MLNEPFMHDEQTCPIEQRSRTRRSRTQSSRPQASGLPAVLHGQAARVLGRGALPWPQSPAALRRPLPASADGGAPEVAHHRSGERWLLGAHASRHGAGALGTCHVARAAVAGRPQLVR
eukprot:1033517-Prymnesium_polylepis.2